MLHFLSFSNNFGQNKIFRAFKIIPLSQVTLKMTYLTVLFLLYWFQSNKNLFSNELWKVETSPYWLDNRRTNTDNSFISSINSILSIISRLSVFPEVRSTDWSKRQKCWTVFRSSAAWSRSSSRGRPTRPPASSFLRPAATATPTSASSWSRERRSPGRPTNLWQSKFSRSFRERCGSVWPISSWPIFRIRSKSVRPSQLASNRPGKQKLSNRNNLT